MRALLLATVLLAAAPGALADLTLTGTTQRDEARVFCDVAQSEPATYQEPARCDVVAEDSGIDLLRVRVVGAAHAFAYVDHAYNETYQPQLGALDCRAAADKPYAMCARVLTTDPRGLSLRFALHALVDGPGGAVVTVHLERVGLSLP